MKLAYLVLLWGLLVYVPLMVPVSAHAGQQADEVKGEAGEDQSDKPVEARKQLSDDELFDIYYKFIAKIKPYGLPADRKEHEKAVNPVVRGWGGAAYREIEYYVDLGTEDIHVAADGNTGDIRSYTLGLVMEHGPPQVKEKYAPPKVPAKLAALKVEEIAKSYLFLNTVMELKEYKLTATYLDNLWYITFERQLGGVSFERDAISMFYSEKYGLLSYRNQLFSDECDVKAKKTKEDALAAADTYFAEVNKKLGIKPPMAFDGGRQTVDY